MVVANSFIKMEEFMMVNDTKAKYMDTESFIMTMETLLIMVNGKTNNFTEKERYITIVPA